jgi:hypothetical protein
MFRRARRKHKTEVFESLEEPSVIMNVDVKEEQ